ncbi:MAG TPA: glycosyltransferase [Chitinophagaceae bacterium]|jgi:hypothetical protein|nr:glycosyltransferase [Chitinophagaceae bacterium]
MPHTILLCPLYNDEASFNIFAAAVEALNLNTGGNSISFLVVNDGTPTLRLKTSLPLTIIHLHRNIGHQKAVAIGLSYAEHHLSFDQVIVMDCDGEDQPEDIRRLLEVTANAGIVVAKRISRQESKSFQFFYKIYKTIFLVFIGQRISFGNFMLLRKPEVAKIVHYSEIWNHLAGAIIKTKMHYTSISTHRGKRYEGTSKMNFTALLLHGLGAIGVFIETIAARMLIFSLIMILVSGITILSVLSIKFFTDKAIPGWTSIAISSMLIVLLQSFLLSLFTIFLYLSFGAQRKFIPAYHYNDYVRSVENPDNG